MKLSDLKTGMRIITKNGDEYIVLKDVNFPLGGKGDMYVQKGGEFMASNCYNEDMTLKNKDKNKPSQYDIIKVYAQHNGRCIDARVISGNINNFDLIWERKEPKKMTVSEICKELGYEVEIIKED